MTPPLLFNAAAAVYIKRSGMSRGLVPDEDRVIILCKANADDPNLSESVLAPYFATY